MKRIFLMLTLTALAGCSSERTVVKKELPEKKELPVWQVLLHAGEGQKRFSYEDTWYIYNMDISYASADTPRKVSGDSTGRQCKVDKAEYMVYDKEMKAVVKDTVLTQAQCSECHQR